jgi:hypothetical protein
MLLDNNVDMKHVQYIKYNNFKNYLERTKRL